MSYVESYVSDEEEDYVEAQGYDRRTPRRSHYAEEASAPLPPPVMNGAMGDKSAVGSVYAMGAGPAIITELRNVGVNVLSIESNADILSYLDAVATETLVGEQCLLYTDSNGRTFNVVVSVSWRPNLFLRNSTYVYHVFSQLIFSHTYMFSSFQFLL